MKNDCFDYNNNNYLKYNIDKNIKIENNNYIKGYGNLYDALQGYIDKATSIDDLRKLRQALQGLNNNNSQTISPSVARANIPPARTALTQNVQAFIGDMFGKTQNDNFRGWILPNGQLLSQYQDDNGQRQDHSKLIRLFIKGLETFDRDSYTRMMQLYNQYVANNSGANDIHESFAVEVLGWVQVSVFGRRRILYRGERWQDRLIDVFVRDYSFDLEVSNKGTYQDFSNLYDSAMDIISSALNNTYDNQVLGRV